MASVYGAKQKGKRSKAVCLFVARTHRGLNSWKLVQQQQKKRRHPSLWVRDAVCPGWTSCFRYRVSPVEPHAGSESHLFTSRLQAADFSSPRVTGRGGDQISFWNFNLLKLNYLISEPPTSKEYLRSLLSGFLDGGFQYRLLKDSPILHGCPAVWMTLCWTLANQRYTAAINHSALKPERHINLWLRLFWISHWLVNKTLASCLACSRHTWKKRRMKQLLWFEIKRRRRRKKDSMHNLLKFSILKSHTFPGLKFYVFSQC